jgi:streptogramin lyase
MSSRRVLGALLALSLLSACGPHAFTPAATGGGANGSLLPQAFQKNDGASFVEYPALACSKALGQIGHGTTGTSMWFALPTLCTKDYGGVGKISLATGVIVEYKLGGKAMPLAIAESGGYVWAADQNRSGKGRNIYRLNEDGTFKTFLLPNAIAVTGLAAGSDGNLWFCGSYVKSGQTEAGVGNMTPDGNATLYTMTGATTPVLTSIAAAADGNLWVTDQQNGAILRVTTSGIVTTFSVGGHPLNITDSDKVVVYSDSSVGQISVMTLLGKYTVYPAPTGEFPGSIARKGHGIIAYIDTANNSSAVGTFDSTNGTYATEVQAPNTGLRYMFNAPDGNAWFTDAYGHVGAYLKYILTTNPTQVTLSSTVCSATFKAREGGFTGDLSATSQNTTVANVSPGSGPSGSTFTITSGKAGTTSILVQDTMQNVVLVQVTVSAPCKYPNNCPALPGGTGNLADGDFSGALNEMQTYTSGQTLAPNWVVTQAGIGFYGSESWGAATPDDLCSVNLDSNGDGGIASQQLATVGGTTYEVTFYFSGNTGGNPVNKTLLVSAGDKSETLTWNDGNGGAQQGLWVAQLWRFVANGSNTTLSFASEDQGGTDYGPVVAGVAVSPVQK